MSRVKRKQVHENMVRLLDAVVAATTVAGVLATDFDNGKVVDGFTLTTADRLLIKDQASGIENGNYIVAVSGAPARVTASEDLKTGTQASGAEMRVTNGDVNGGLVFKCTNNRGTSTVGTDALVFESTQTISAVPTQDDKDLAVAGDTSGDEAATGENITNTPSFNSHVLVKINGVTYVTGDGVKTDDCYFSSDGGTTARTINAITAGDELIWNGVISGFDLETDDRIDLDYDV